jgi:EAL domain-containing protein (putative c-di-GMP-specific phosphodiesterase class I)
VAGAAKLEPHQTLSLNLSPMTIEAPEFQPQPLLGVLARAGISPDRIILEITERQGIDQLDTLRTKLGACRAAGFRIAIDDLGAGNSGLRLLSQIHFDIVKIDLSLVQGGVVRATSQEVVLTLKDLADRWGALVIAEGVETVEQLEFVRSLGIRAGQGYLLGVPLERPSTETLDLEELIRGQGLRLGEGMRSVSGFGAGA